MRLWHGSRGAAVCAAACVASPASAQHFEGRASFTAAGTYSRTITDAPSPTTLTLSGPSVSLSPSVSLVHETPRTTSTLSHAFALNLPFDEDQKLARGPRSYSQNLRYAGRYQVSELTRVSLALSFHHRPTNALDVAADPSQTALDAVPAGASYVLGTSASIGFTRLLSPVLSLTESNGFSYNAPIHPRIVTPKTIGALASLSIDRQLEVDTLGVMLAVEMSYFTAGEAIGAGVIAPRVQLANTLSGTWTRALTDAWRWALTFGATQVVSPAAERPTAIQPTGTAALTYRFEVAAATLSYAHQAAPNLATGAVSFTDALTLRFSVPFGETGLLCTGSGGFSRMTPIGSRDGEPTSTLLGDASLTWRPPISQSLSLSLRGQVQRQIGGADPLGAFTRVSGSLNLAYAYPSAAAASVPPMLPPALGLSPPAPSEGFSRAIEAPNEPPASPR